MGTLFDDAYFDDFEDDLEEVYREDTPRSQRQVHRPRQAECRHCGVAGLTWRQDDDGWFLEDSHGYVHECDVVKVHKNTADDF